MTPPPTALSTQLSCFLLRRRSEKPSEGHSCRDRGLAPHLLRGVLRCVRGSHCYDALLPAGQEQPPASGLYVCGLGWSHLCRGHWLFMCLVDQVRGSPAASLRKRTFKHLHACFLSRTLNIHFYHILFCWLLYLWWTSRGIKNTPLTCVILTLLNLLKGAKWSVCIQCYSVGLHPCHTDVGGVHVPFRRRLNLLTPGWIPCTQLNSTTLSKQTQQVERDCQDRELISVIEAEHYRPCWQLFVS